MEYDTSPRNCAGRTPSSRPGPLPGVAAVTYDATTPFPGAWALLPVGGTGLVIAAAATHRTAAEKAIVAAAVAENPECFGAAAVEPGTSCDPVGDHLWTSPGFAAQDKPQVYQDGCWNDPPYGARRTCTYGPGNAGTRVALLGNSHAGQWFPA